MAEKKRDIWKEEIAPLIDAKNRLCTHMQREYGKVTPSSPLFWRINDINAELNEYPEYVRSHGKAKIVGENNIPLWGDQR